MDMDFLLPAGHLARRDEFHAFAGKELAPAADSFTQENIRKLARCGAMGLPIRLGMGRPERKTFYLISFSSKIYRGFAPPPGVILAVHTSVGGFFALFYFKVPPHRSGATTDRLGRGSLLGRLRASGADAGSDAAALRISALARAGEAAIS